ncbi:dihydroneopterin aldolase [bacterium]|nr:dihydroneopterin aldolase [bacterium]
MSDDVIRIRNMRFYAYHGLLPEENVLGQLFEVDVEVFGSFSGWASYGADPDVTQIKGAINYPEVVELVDSIVTGERYGLVESIADRAASAIEERFGVEKLIVRVRKPSPPVAAQFDGIEVEVTRGFE